jgi:hypothetical protein
MKRALIRIKIVKSQRLFHLSLVTVLIGALLSLLITPANATPTTCYVVENGVLTNGSGCSGNVVIDGSVTAIGQYNGGYGAFQESGITSVTIPASVTSIAYGAFWDRVNLTSVTFSPNSTLASIEMFAFAGTQNLKSITLPSSLASIGSMAFSGSGIRYMTFEGAPPGIVNYNGPGNLQNVSGSAIAWVTPGNFAAFNSQSPTILPTIRSLTGSTPPPTIFSPTNGETLTATVGVSFSQSVSFIGVGTPTLEISSGSLPPGISLNGSGVFVGTPTTTAPLVTRTYPVSLRVIDGADSATVSIVFEILPPPLPQIWAETFTANVGIPINKSVSFDSSGSGTITVVQGSLPPGVSISGSNRIIGTPTSAGTYNAKLRITDSYSQSVTSDDFGFEIGSPVTVSISASQASMNLTAYGETATYSMISTSAPDNFIICGFYKDADDSGGGYFVYDCTQKQWSSWVSNGITSEEYYYTDYENSTLTIRVYGPDASAQENPDINTPYLATVTVSLNRVIPQPTVTISATDFQPRTATNVGVALSNFDTS